jgi:regulatory protein YycI of two-component signal transduction system YycFG
MANKHLTFEDIYNNADILIKEDGSIIHWFDMDEDDIEQKAITLYSGKHELERIKVSRKVERVADSKDTYRIILDNSLYEVKPYTMKPSKPL